MRTLEDFAVLHNRRRSWHKLNERKHQKQTKRSCKEVLHQELIDAEHDTMRRGKKGI